MSAYGMRAEGEAMRDAAPIPGFCFIACTFSQ
jgi:hypothetical protein